MSSFKGENMQTQFNVLSCRTDLYFHDYKLAIDIDENGSTDYEMKRKKAVEGKLGCKFIRIDPGKQSLNQII